MGGRSSSFRHSGGSQPRAMDEDEYLASKGLDSPLSDELTDKVGGYERGMSANPRAREEAKRQKSINDYHAQRQQAIKDYQSAVNSGKLRPRTGPERTWRTAQGNPNNRSVRAARRILTKRGIDWKTGKRIKGFVGRGYPEIDKRTGLERYKKK